MIQQNTTYTGTAYVSKVGHRAYEVNDITFQLTPNEPLLQNFYDAVGIKWKHLNQLSGLDVLIKSDGTGTIQGLLDPKLEDKVRPHMPPATRVYWSGSARFFDVKLAKAQKQELIAALRRMEVNWHYRDWLRDLRHLEGKEEPVREFLDSLRM